MGQVLNLHRHAFYVRSGYSGDGVNEERIWQEWQECDCGARIGLECCPECCEDGCHRDVRQRAE